MFDDRLDDRLRSTLRQVGDELSLTVTTAELERRLRMRRRARNAQRSALIAAAVGVIAIGALVASAPSWFRQMPNQIAATASPKPTAPAAVSPSDASALPDQTPLTTSSGRPATGMPVIRYLDYDGHAFEIAIDGSGRHAVPEHDLKWELGIAPDAPWVKDSGASPDGRLTVVVSGNEVRVRSIDSSAADTILTLPPGDTVGEGRTSWSPNARYLAVWSGGNGPIAPHSMWVLDVRTGRATAGPVDTIGFIDAAWSPDGARIADGGREGLQVVTASTGDTKVLRMGADVSGYGDLQWSPDGRWLVFHPATAAYEIHRLNADTMGRKRLALGTGARWTPDGSKIIYLRESADAVGPGWHFEIWTMLPDGSDKRPLITKPCPCRDLKLSADGRWLTFIASRGQHDDVWVVAINGQNARRLARDTNIVAWVSP